MGFFKSLLKVAGVVLAAGAVIFTAGAALGITAAAGGWGAAAATVGGGLASALGGSATLAGILTGAIQYAGIGAVVGGVLSAVKGGDVLSGMAGGALTGGITGGIMGGLGIGGVGAPAESASSVIPPTGATPVGGSSFLPDPNASNLVNFNPYDVAVTPNMGAASTPSAGFPLLSIPAPGTSPTPWASSTPGVSPTPLAQTPPSLAQPLAQQAEKIIIPTPGPTATPQDWWAYAQAKTALNPPAKGLLEQWGPTLGSVGSGLIASAGIPDPGEAELAVARQRAADTAANYARPAVNYNPATFGRQSPSGGGYQFNQATKRVEWVNLP